MVGRLREGRYVIPEFQRDFEWEPWDIKELMSCIFRDYYIGHQINPHLRVKIQANRLVDSA